jgi:hypothetical protein
MLAAHDAMLQEYKCAHMRHRVTRWRRRQHTRVNSALKDAVDLQIVVDVGRIVQEPTARALIISEDHFAATTASLLPSVQAVGNCHSLDSFYSALAEWKNGMVPLLTAASAMIKRAWYGQVDGSREQLGCDVTLLVKLCMQNIGGVLTFRVDNTVLGDPVVGREKFLRVHFGSRCLSVILEAVEGSQLRVRSINNATGSFSFRATLKREREQSCPA